MKKHSLFTRASLVACLLATISTFPATVCAAADGSEGDVLARFCAARASATLHALQAMEESLRPVSQADLEELSELVKGSKFVAIKEEGADRRLLVESKKFSGDVWEISVNPKRILDILMVHPAAFDHLLLHELLGLLGKEDSHDRLSSKLPASDLPESDELKTLIAAHADHYATYGLFGEDYRDVRNSPDFVAGPISVIERMTPEGFEVRKVLSFRSRLLTHKATGRVFRQFYTWQDRDDGGNTFGWYEDPATLTVVAEIHDSGIERCTVRSLYPITLYHH